jgi:hypothetical protein
MNKKIFLKTLVIALLSVLVISSITPSASSITKEKNNIETLAAMDSWSDNFDLYANDQFLDGGPDDGGWKGWDNVPEVGAYVRDDQAQSPPYSVEVAGDTDLVHEYTGCDSSQWTYTAWQFIPDDFAGDSYFILLSDYVDGAGQSNTWAVQLSFNSETGVVQSQGANDELMYTTGQWIEIRCEIDLTGDYLQIYYDGELLAEHLWTDTVNGGGGGTLELDAVDLFANGASPVYYDDISLTTIVPPKPDLDCTGALSWDNVDPGATVTGSFQVGNIGEAGSLLNWDIESYPTDWGTWTFTPDSGTGLADGSWVTVDVSVVAPNEKNKEFTGKVKVINSDDPTDFCEIDIILKTPREKTLYNPLVKILEQFPIVFSLLKYVRGL